MSVKVTVKMVCIMLNKQVDMLEAKKSDLENEMGEIQDNIDDLENSINTLEGLNGDLVLSELFEEVSKPKAPAKKKAVKKPVKAKKPTPKHPWKL